MSVYCPEAQIKELRDVTVEIDTEPLFTYNHANIYFSSAFPPGMDLVEYKDRAPFFIRHDKISRIISPAFNMEESTGLIKELKKHLVDFRPNYLDCAMCLDDPDKYKDNDPELDFVMF